MSVFFETSQKVAKHITKRLQAKQALSYLGNQIHNYQQALCTSSV